MTSKSPLSPHFRGVSCTATILRSVPDCSASKGLKFYNNHIEYGIVIDQIEWIRTPIHIVGCNLPCPSPYRPTTTPDAVCSLIVVCGGLHTLSDIMGDHKPPQGMDWVVRVSYPDVARVTAPALSGLMLSSK